MGVTVDSRLSIDRDTHYGGTSYSPSYSPQGTTRCRANPRLSTPNNSRTSMLKRIHKMSRTAPFYSPIQPLVGFPRGRTYFTEHALRIWIEHAIIEVGALYENGQLQTFAELAAGTDLPNGQFLTHRQLLTESRRLWYTIDTEPPTQPVLHTILQMGLGRHLVRCLYKAGRELVVVTLREKWEAEFQRPLHDNDWEYALEFPKKVSRNYCLKNIQYHMLH